jgi:hypothetical protein
LGKVEVIMEKHAPRAQERPALELEGELLFSPAVLMFAFLLAMVEVYFNLVLIISVTGHRSSYASSGGNSTRAWASD